MVSAHDVHIFTPMNLYMNMRAHVYWPHFWASDCRGVGAIHAHESLRAWVSVCESQHEAAAACVAVGMAASL